MTERRSRPFAEWLQEQRAGAAHGELSDALNELVEAVSETGKAGTLTIAVKVKPAGRGAGGTVLVTDSYNLKKPQPDRSEAVFFIDTDNNLTRHNPAQPSLPLREVPKNVDPDTGELREAK